LPQSPHLRRTIDALCLAAPFCMASRYEDMCHCVEASEAGARALRKYKVKARILPCAVMGVNAARDRCVSIGVPASTLRAYGGVIQDEEALAAERVFHAVIEASHAGDRAVIDLTFGQLKGMHGMAPPLVQVSMVKGWPSFHLDGFDFAYGPSHDDEWVREHATKWNGSGFVDDLLNLMNAALHVRNDRDAFYGLLYHSDPDGFTSSARRILAWSSHP
jgi:hypothetical protein